MIKKELLLLANERLQVRIEELTKQVSELKDINSEQTITIKNLTLDNKQLLDKADHKETIIKKYQISRGIISLEGGSTISREKKLKKIAMKNKIDDRKRKKSIYGILKNKYRYNLSQTEIKFLESINHRNAITPKQFEWYNSIAKRGKIT